MNENPKSISRRDFLKICGMHAGMLGLGIVPGAFKSMDAAYWQVAPVVERLGLAKDIVTGWVSDIANTNGPKGENINWSTIDPEREYISLQARGNKTLSRAGKLGNGYIRDAQWLGPANPISALIEPTAVNALSADILKFAPQQADVLKVIKADPTKPDWFAGTAISIPFDILVAATAKLSDPHDRYSYNGVDGNGNEQDFYSLYTKAFWTGALTETQWNKWLNEVIAGANYVAVPDAPISTGALATHANLQKLFPGVKMPPLELTPSTEGQPEEFYSQKPGVTVNFQDSIQPNARPFDDNIKSLFEVLKEARKAMKDIQGKYYLTQEMIKRVMSGNTYTYNDPIHGLSASDGGSNPQWTTGMQIRFNPQSPYTGRYYRGTFYLSTLA